MRDFTIIVDTTSDLSKEVLEDFNLKLIKAHFVDEDGKDKVSFTDWSECTYYNGQADFFKHLKANPDGFKTSPNSVYEVTECFKEEIKKDKDILAITISSTMSGTFNMFNSAKKDLEGTHNCEIKIVDSMRFGGGIGLLAIKASILRSEGKTLDEVYDYLEANKNTFHQMGWLDDLSFVAKKGRITHSKAFFGQLIGIKPLGESDQNGLTTVLGKAKGEKGAYPAMLSYIEKTIENPSEQNILICHSVREKQALEYKRLIEEKFKPKKVYIIECGPSCGINIGPGLMSCYYQGKPISKDLVEEKALMESILTK